MKTIGKTIKIIIAIVLLLLFILGIFVGINCIDDASKMIDSADVQDFKLLNEYVAGASNNGYYIDPKLLVEGTEKDYSFIVKKNYKRNKLLYSENIIFFSYTEKYYEDNWVFINGYSSQGIASASIIITTGEKPTLLSRINKKKAFYHGVDKKLPNDFYKKKIDGAETICLTYITQIHEYGRFVLSAERELNKECIVKIVVDWDIDINNYDYEAMKQTALDYMAYIIRNVQPPIV